jgi:hypothetical protein
MGGGGAERATEQHEHHAGVGHRAHPGNRHLQALGAPRSHILTQFLIEAVAISSIGGMLGRGVRYPAGSQGGRPECHRRAQVRVSRA